jgi:hypothetical protein
MDARVANCKRAPTGIARRYGRNRGRMGSGSEGTLDESSLSSRRLDHFHSGAGAFLAGRSSLSGTKLNLTHYLPMGTVFSLEQLAFFWTIYP